MTDVDDDVSTLVRQKRAGCESTLPGIYLVI